jgi:hypothetical protein
MSWKAQIKEHDQWALLIYNREGTAAVLRNESFVFAGKSRFQLRANFYIFSNNE